MTDAPPARPALTAVQLAARALLLLALALLAVWLWSRLCRFPSVPWNDMRLAPSVALAQGWPVYPTADTGTINTWMYGPLPLLLFLPAAWAPSAADALMIAAVINAALTIGPLALVCAFWPAGSPTGASRLARTAAFALCLALWPELHYSVIFSDNLAVACGLVGNLLLVRARSSLGFWLAAAVATAAVGCKQIALGIPLAQVVWLGVTAGSGAAWRHAGRCAACGAVIGGALIAKFGWAGLWFTLVEIPGGLGWAPDVALRLRAVAAELALLVALPAVTMMVARRFFAPSALRLAALAWLCALPLGLAGMMKVGGWTNSLHGFVLWLPPVLVSALARPTTRRALAPLGAAAAALALTAGRVLAEPEFTLRPQLAAYHEAEGIAAQFAGAVWFPMHPLVTLYSDRHYYHDEDGLYTRSKAGKPIPEAQAAAHLPAAMRAIAQRHDWTDWGIARRMLPPQSAETVIGHWTLRTGRVAEKTP
ncbi:MAG: hypothetical protein Q8N18_13425 [Opitutaceae bacterium]|nr:hypothetical protein [Opitutaceae bacterium]